MCKNHLTTARCSSRRIQHGTKKNKVPVGNRSFPSTTAVGHKTAGGGFVTKAAVIQRSIIVRCPTSHTRLLDLAQLLVDAVVVVLHVHRRCEYLVLELLGKAKQAPVLLQQSSLADGKRRHILLLWHLCVQVPVSVQQVHPKGRNTGEANTTWSREAHISRRV